MLTEAEAEAISEAAEAMLLNSLGEGVLSHTSDGETTTAFPLKDQIEAVKFASGVGSRSGWGRLRIARAIPGGAGPA